MKEKREGEGKGEREREKGQTHLTQPPCCDGPEPSRPIPVRTRDLERRETSEHDKEEDAQRPSITEETIITGAREGWR